MLKLSAGLLLLFRETCMDVKDGNKDLNVCNDYKARY